MEAARANPTRGLTAVAGPPVAMADHSVLYRDCPECQQPMHRKNFGRRSGIIVDWCREHGTWLDAEELERVAAFVMSGALESAERAHAESVAAEAAAAAARATRPEEREAWILAHTTLGGQTMRAGQGGRNRGAGALVGAFLRELLGG
jgi:Zn-finger nucleic acid-binding protein